MRLVGLRWHEPNVFVALRNVKMVLAAKTQWLSAWCRISHIPQCFFNLTAARKMQANLLWEGPGRTNCNFSVGTGADGDESCK